MADQQINVTELDFLQIKENLRNFFKNSSSTVYRDWDYEGSGLSTLVELLSYNTHYNAMLAHMSVNETFLDTAQLRHNVVGRAKLLGYIPHSYRSASAAISVRFSSGASDLPLELPRGSSFSTALDGIQFTFITLEAHVAPAIDGFYTFPSILVHEGSIKTSTFTVDENVPNQKFIIPDSNVDLSTLRVRVRENINSSSSETFTEFTNLAAADGSSAIYFISENFDGRYMIYFGDGIFGKKLTSLSVIELEYLVTAGPEANGANAFTYTSGIGGTPLITVLSRAANGGTNESIDSIRFNAPLALIAQNRAVTADDYKALILRDFGAVDAINVWGGEQQPEPEYGKVFISIKPLEADVLTDLEKKTIIDLLKTRNVVTIAPVMVDPDYVNIYLDVNFKYDSNRTNLNSGELKNAVINTIIAYNDGRLQKFDGVFRHSQFLRSIDGTSPAILSSSARVFVYKTIPLEGQVNSVNSFATPVTMINGESYIDSSSFIHGSNTVYVGDEVNPVNAQRRNLFLYKIENGARVRVLLSAGYLEPDTGTLVLTGFSVTGSQSIRINVSPRSLDIAPKRNQLLKIDVNSTTVTGEIDTIAVAGSSGASSYVTFPKNR